ncbi:MAG: DUF1015 family protein [Acidimicrobiia bacterium]|nr:DUF1015 family protein [Acidimicrobiia bacterium]
MSDLRAGLLRLIEPGFEHRVPAPAYDSLGPSARRQHLAANPDSYLGVTQSLEDEPTLSVGEVLARGRTALDRLRALGAFGPAERRWLLYRLEVDDHVQTGIVGELAVSTIDSGRLRPHEQTFPERADLLADHLDVVGAQSSPIAVAHRRESTLAASVADASERPPLRDFAGADGLRQTVWALPLTEAIAALDDEPLYLLDGHHRAAAAAAHAARRQLGPDDPGGWLLAALFPADALRIWGFDRRVLDPRFSASEAVARVAERVPIQPAVGPWRPTSGHEIGVYTAGQWYRAEVDPVGTGPLAELAPVRLQAGILEPVFGITDPQLDHRLEHLPGGRDPGEQALETDEEGGVLFTVAAITIEQLMAVADQRLVLPPKSTFITPKVRSGVFLREL